MAPRVHQFHAVAFVENFALRELAPALPGARLGTHDLHVSVSSGGDVFVHSFGAIVFHDVPEAQREEWIERVRSARPGLTRQVVAESFTVHEEPGARTDVRDGALEVDRMTTGRAAVIALIVGQSAAMEYYERLVDDLFSRTAALSDRLEKRGSVSMRTARLHQFIGEAIGSRQEVLSVLHLLDKPDEAWDDAEIDRIYADLRAEFDLVDRYSALESKLRGIQESLELVLDMARERRMWILEVGIALLIAIELVLALVRHG